jgi:predicted acetyltransferase
MCGMSDFQLRAVREEEFPEVHRVASAAFGEVADPAEEAAARAGFNSERSLCAFDDGRLVATSTVYSMELVVPGGDSLPAGGVTWVAALPTHRRLGLLRRMMTGQIDRMAQNREAVSVLLSSEGGIYRRFGYGPATWVTEFKLDTRSARLESGVKPRGRITLLNPSQAREILLPLFERLRPWRVGEVSRPGGWWTEYLFDPKHHREEGGGMFHVVHTTAAGDADGYATYRVKVGSETESPCNTLRLVEIVTDDSESYAALWDYLLHVDLVRTVAFSRGRLDEPLRWLLADPRALRIEGLTDYLWVRILDVPRALSSRTYAHPGRLVLEIRRSFPEDTSARYRLVVETPGGRAACSSTEDDPDLYLDDADLGSMFLGGVSCEALAGSGRVREMTAGAKALADSMFMTKTQPYCCTLF